MVGLFKPGLSCAIRMSDGEGDRGAPTMHRCNTLQCMAALRNNAWVHCATMQGCKALQCTAPMHYNAQMQSTTMLSFNAVYQLQCTVLLVTHCSASRHCMPSLICFIVLHLTELHYIALHCLASNCTALHCTASFCT